MYHSTMQKISCHICKKIDIGMNNRYFRNDLYCEICINTINPGPCKKCRNQQSFKRSSFMCWSATCMTCEKMAIEKLKSLNNSLPELLITFKIYCKFLDKLNFPTADEFEFLNKINEQKILNVSQTVLLSNWIEENVPDKYSTEIFHVVFPCVYDIYAVLKHPGLKGSDRLVYYRWNNLEQLFFIWSWCRLSRNNNKPSTIDCYICFENVQTDIVGKRDSGMVRTHKTSLFQCLNCGNVSHRKCVEKMHSKKCGICSKKWEILLDYVVVDAKHMLMYMGHANIKRFL